MLERAKETTRFGKYTYIEYARFEDDLVILIDAYPRHDWLMAAVEKRLREELADLQVEINEEKSRNRRPRSRRKLRLFWDSTFAAYAVVEGHGVPITRRSSRGERRCSGSSKMCFAATNRSQWIGLCS